ncbi:MAG: PEP-CTERM sorting domain-containing protein [Acidobacteriota bacterium]|nr:PEP-CTERM sorting domain-containing protein [Acidobacteriota bacterium]
MATAVIAAKLYQIDPATGVAKLVGPTTLGLGAVVNVNGTVYGFDDSAGQVVTLDLANGKTTFVTNFDPAAGLIFGASPVPEPTSMALAGIGIVLIAFSRRRRSRRRYGSDPVKVWKGAQ